MNKKEKISKILLISHIVIVCLLASWSYADIHNLGYTRYFKIGNYMQLIIFYLTIFLFPLIALILALIPKLKIKDAGWHLLLHTIFSVLQMWAFIPLIS